MDRLISKKRSLGTLIALIILLALPANIFAAEPNLKWDMDKAIEDTGKYLLKTVKAPTYGAVGGDWTVLALARSGLKLPDNYADNYYRNIERILIDKGGELHRNKYSEYSRVILSLTAIGKEPSDIAGFNMLARLSDIDNIKKQGINGPIYALIALDSLSYEVPESSDAATQTDRDLLIKSILERELPGGGFNLSGSSADADVSSAVLQAFSNYQHRVDVKDATERCLSFLSSVQAKKGGFSGLTTGGEENAESVAQVIIALTALGIDPATDTRFIKIDSDGIEYNPLDALMGFRNEDGSYRHIEGGETDIMATEQAMMAVVSYQRMIGEEKPLFNMKDASYMYKVLLNGKYLSFSQPPINESGRILVPMRKIFESLGAEVKWDGDKSLVTGIFADKSIELKIGSLAAKVDGLEIELDVPAVIKNGTTLVPLRFISESLEKKVEWDGEKDTVIIGSE
jgi:prenyltransferase beta subunit